MKGLPIGQQVMGNNLLGRKDVTKLSGGNSIGFKHVKGHTDWRDLCLNFHFLLFTSFLFFLFYLLISFI